MVAYYLSLLFYKLSVLSEQPLSLLAVTWAMFVAGQIRISNIPHPFYTLQPQTTRTIILQLANTARLATTISVTYKRTKREWGGSKIFMWKRIRWEYKRSDNMTAASFITKFKKHLKLHINKLLPHHDCDNWLNFMSLWTHNNLWTMST